MGSGYEAGRKGSFFSIGVAAGERKGKRDSRDSGSDEYSRASNVLAEESADKAVMADADEWKSFKRLCVPHCDGDGKTAEEVMRPSWGLEWRHYYPTNGACAGGAAM